MKLTNIIQKLAPFAFAGAAALGGVACSTMPQTTVSPLVEVQKRMYEKEIKDRYITSTVIPFTAEMRVEYDQAGRSEVADALEGIYWHDKTSAESTAAEIVEELDLDDLTANEFARWRQVTTKAFTLSGIRNPQRYSIEVMEESNRNLTDAAHGQGKPLALFFLSAFDYKQTFLGIRALSFKTSEIDNFLDAYSVVVFEFSDWEEIGRHMERIKERYPNENNIAGLVIGAHGTENAFQAGAKNEQTMFTHGVYGIFAPFVSLFRDDAMIFLASCNNGKGKEKANNMANAFATTFTGRAVYSCTDTLMDFSYRQHEDGTIDPKSIRMVGPMHIAMPGDCTYVARCDDGKEECTARYVSSQTNIEREDVRHLQKLGITNVGALLHFSWEEIASIFALEERLGTDTVRKLAAGNWFSLGIGIRRISEIVDYGVSDPSVLATVAGSPYTIQDLWNFCNGTAKYVENAWVSGKEKTRTLTKNPFPEGYFSVTTKQVCAELR